MSTRYWAVAGRLAGWIAVMVLTIGISCSVQAAELRIVDSQGLTRAVRKIQRFAEVRIEGQAKEGATATMRLSSVDGIAPDVIGEPLGRAIFQFRVVSPGTWQIVSPDGSVDVKSVRISPQD